MMQGREPFQYLISAAHWHSYVLSVGPGVLVPRPETEIFPELVDLVGHTFLHKHHACLNAK